MRVLCVGGCGRICRESVLDLLQTARCERVTIGDLDEKVCQEVVDWLDDPCVDYRRVDVRDHEATVALMREYDLVMDGLPISMNDASAACMAEAGINAVNLNGLSNEWSFDRAFRDAGKVFVPGFGMTPGTTNLMVMHAANQLDKVDEVYISHGAFRPIAFSKAIAETTCLEYAQNLATRVVYEDGLFKQVPPFGRPRSVALPEPFGEHLQYIIPHPEPVTLARKLASKGVRLIEVRGTWPPKNMQLLRALCDWGFLRNGMVEAGGARFPVMEAIADHLVNAEEGRTTDLYGYALHVEVTGSVGGEPRRHVLYTTHPPSDGSVPDWAGLRAYTRSVGIPMSVAAQILARGGVKAAGALPPEDAFDPEEVFGELAKRGIVVHGAA